MDVAPPSSSPTPPRPLLPDDSRSEPPGAGWREIALAALLGTALTWVFWWPLWQGGGLMGGDLYSYYFPQKAWLSECLREGSIPLWNPRVGFGYPVLGESQTGALYPVNLVLYRWCSLNTAYNTSQILHYIVTFVVTFVLLRRWRLATAGALLGAVAFTYGWFPPRICWEWAIIGGCWLVLVLWCFTRFLQSERRRFLVLASLGLGLGLLAGHYQMMFIALMTLIPLVLLLRPKRHGPSWSLLGGMALAIVCGFLLAGVQLASSWELKSHSQRRAGATEFRPAAGHLPPAAISQLWIPWSWYAGTETFDQSVQNSRWLAVPESTNQVEAQLYVGLLPLWIGLCGLLIPAMRKRLGLTTPWGWLGLALFSLLLSTGWPTYYLQHLPGVGFFRGAGRYSVMAILSLAALAGAGWDALLKGAGRNVMFRALATGVLISLTVADLWWASRQYETSESTRFGRQVFYSVLVDDPPIRYLEESPLRGFFAEFPGTARLYAPGANIPSLLGVSTIPVYLGLGPELYESEELRIDFANQDPARVREAVDRLRRFGVTHLLLEQSLPANLWPVSAIGEVIDPFLNRAFGRREPFYLYHLTSATGPASLEDGNAEDRILAIRHSARTTSVDVQSTSATRLILRELWFPGWKLTDESLTSERFDGIFRSLNLPADSSGSVRTITWIYRPASLFWGIAMSVAGLILMGFLAWLPKHKRSPMGAGDVQAAP